MAEGNPALWAFNRGLISPLALARTDVKRLALASEVQTNWMPRTLGSMMLRPGLEYIVSTPGNQRARYLPFVFSTTDRTLIECTNGSLRIIGPGPDGTPSVPLTRPAVSSVVTNGRFIGNLAGWTNADQSGAVSQWVAGNQMELLGTGFNAAIERQTVPVFQVNVEHALRIVVTLGVVTLNIGTADGDGTYAMNLALGVGTHSIAFTPTGNFHLQFSNATLVSGRLSSATIEAAGTFTLPTPWVTSDLRLLREDQSAEVLYVACQGHRQQKIQRWGAAGTLGQHSWSILPFMPMDGPFKNINVTPTALSPSARTGIITLAASQPLFQPGHVGALFRIASNGQVVSVASAGVNQFTSAVQITGLSAGGGRDVTIDINGTFVGTVVLQRSVGVIGNWENVVGQTWTAPVTVGFSDGLDNQVIFYRLGFGATYTSGVANCSLSTAANSIIGVCRVIGYTSAVAVTAQVLIQPGNTGTLSGFGDTSAVTTWWEGIWSDTRGYPTSVALYEGRLGWAGKNAIVLSASDAYESYDESIQGDAAAIVRTVGSGPVDVINWLLPLADLVAGGQGAEMDIRSSVLGGIITPADFVIKNCSTQGSAAVPALRVDNDGFYLQRSARRLYKLVYTPSYLLMNYRSVDMTNFVPDIAISELGVRLVKPGINWIALQRQPDTRIHALLNDGTARVLILEPDEEMQCWIKVQTDGIIEDVVTLPGSDDNSEDLVYYLVARTVGSQTVRYLERWAKEEECWGGTITKCLDAHITGTQSPSATIGGLLHLAGRTDVLCWADGIDQGGPFTVSPAGTILLPRMVTSYCAGLGYTAPYRSTKLAYAAEEGSALTQKKRISQLGLVMQNVHWQGLKYGKDFDDLQDLPKIYKGAPTEENTVYITYDDAEFPFGGAWDTDSRLCLQAASPRPCTVLAAVISMETREGT